MGPAAAAAGAAMAGVAGGTAGREGSTRMTTGCAPTHALEA